MPLKDYSYGASKLPDEDEKTLFPVRFARVTDPAGHDLQIIEGPNDPPYARIALRVVDLDQGTAFYTEMLGLKLLRKRSNLNNRPMEASMMVWLVSILLHHVHQLILHAG